VAPGTSASLESVRLELARRLGRTAFPAGPAELIRTLRHDNAPDALIAPLERLPHRTRYANAHALAQAVVEVAGSGGGRP
jgi:hypothetical protein